MKERVCVWSGTLDQLDSHLDPHLDNCQYVDSNCPLNCLQAMPKEQGEAACGSRVLGLPALWLQRHL